MQHDLTAPTRRKGRNDRHGELVSCRCSTPSQAVNGHLKAIRTQEAATIKKQDSCWGYHNRRPLHFTVHCASLQHKNKTKQKQNKKKQQQKTHTKSKSKQHKSKQTNNSHPPPPPPPKRTKSWWDCLLVACLTSQQHARASQGRIYEGNCTCCHMRYKLQIKLLISPSHGILTPGQPVPALTL